MSNSGGSRPNRLGKGEINNPDPFLWYDTSFNTASAAWGIPALGAQALACSSM